MVTISWTTSGMSGLKKIFFGVTSDNWPFSLQMVSTPWIELVFFVGTDSTDGVVVCGATAVLVVVVVASTSYVVGASSYVDVASVGSDSCQCLLGACFDLFLALSCSFRFHFLCSSCSFFRSFGWCFVFLLSVGFLLCIMVGLRYWYLRLLLDVGLWLFRPFLSWNIVLVGWWQWFRWKEWTCSKWRDKVDIAGQTEDITNGE